MKEQGPLDQLIKAFAGLPALGPRSARRIALHLLTHKDSAMKPLMRALEKTLTEIKVCENCGNLDLADLCRICTDPKRDDSLLCVVEGIADLWAIERTGSYKGRYHILGGVLSALDGIGPDQLKIRELVARTEKNNIQEIIIALGATVDGQTTAHYISDKITDIAGNNIRITRLAHGVPIGGALDYLDDGTITTALKSRSAV